MHYREVLAFDDVLLKPQFSSISSRSEVEFEAWLDKVDHKFTLPLISAPMDTVTGGLMAAEMAKLGGLGIIHRYCAIEEQVSELEKAFLYGASVVGAAIGANNDFYVRAEALLSVNPDVILCVDVAHGHHINVKHALRALRAGCAKKRHIMAGNVATLEAFDDLSDWGADSIRCGVGGGSICTTRIQTGHGVPTLQVTLDCAQSDRGTTLIADSGFKKPGDIVKGFAAGADFVMLGSMLAGTDECPGKVLKKTDGSRYKAYRGMASKAAQMDWRGRSSSPEGVVAEVPYKGPTESVLEDISGAVRSGLSYSGARTIPELRDKAIWLRQTAASRLESSAHINKGQ